MINLSSIATLTGYLAVFIFSVLLARAYENSLASGQLNGGFVRILARSLVILFPVLLIGLRDMSVGYDTDQMTIFDYLFSVAVSTLLWKCVFVSLRCLLFDFVLFFDWSRAVER